MKHINVDLRQLRAFMAVARHESFTHAADEICISQPGLSLMISHLEEQLGVRLFHRSTRHVELSEAGHELVSAAGQILDDFENMVLDVRDLTNRKRGRVSIATLPSLAAAWVPEVISRFNSIYPTINVLLQDTLNSPLIEKIKTGEVDFGIGMELPYERDLSFTGLITDSLIVLLPSGHKLEKYNTIEWMSLLGEKIITMTWDTSVRRLTEQAYAKIGQTLQAAYETSFMPTSISLVKAGLGIAVLPSMALSSLSMSGVKARPLKNPIIKREIGIILKKNRTLTPAAQAFVDLLNEDSVIKEILQNTGSNQFL